MFGDNDLPRNRDSNQAPLFWGMMMLAQNQPSPGAVDVFDP
jgi:hypothetical protein